MWSRRRILYAVLCLGLAAAVSVVVTLRQRALPDVLIEGARFPSRVEVDSHTLTLVGAGVRRVMMFTPYAAALYLEQPTRVATEVMHSEQAKRVHLHLLADLDRKQIEWSFRNVVERNNRKGLAEIESRLSVLYGLLRDAKRGEDILITYTPERGTSVATGRDQVPTLQGPTLGAAMMSIWFGPLPVDADLQRGMLGVGAP